MSNLTINKFSRRISAFCLIEGYEGTYGVCRQCFLKFKSNAAVRNGSETAVTPNANVDMDLLSPNTASPNVSPLSEPLRVKNPEESPQSDPTIVVVPPPPSSTLATPNTVIASHCTTSKYLL